MKYIPELNLIEMDLMDLEHCGFEHDRYEGELFLNGIDNEAAKWPVMMAVNFSGGAAIMVGTDEANLDKMAEWNDKFREYMGRIKVPSRASVNLHDFALKEELADLEHQQWIYWSKNLALAQHIDPERLIRWKRLWNTPYKDLTTLEKRQDLVWAEYVRDVITEFIVKKQAEDGFKTY